MDINYFGHSSFKLSGSRVSVVTDPYDDNVGLRYPKVSGTIVAVSHNHGDHNQVSRVSDYKKIISGPGEYEVEGISIIGFPSYHDNQKGELRGPNTMYVFEIDGVRLAHLGDLGHSLTDKEIEKLGNLHVLMIPVGGHYTIGPQVAAEITRMIEPQIIVPMHYQMEGLNQSVFKDLVGSEPFVNELGIKTEETKKLVVKEADTFSEDQKIVLFSL